MYLLISWALILTLLNNPIFGQSENIIVLTFDGAINPAAADYIQQGIKEAEKNNSDKPWTKEEIMNQLLDCCKE